MSYRCWMAASVAFVVLTACAVGGFVICPRCGYENVDTAAACSHCRAGLAADGVPAATNAPSGEAGDAVTPGHDEVSGARLVDEEIERGRSHFEAGEFEMARLFFRNAAALNLVIESPDRAAYGPQLADLLNRCAAPPPAVRRECVVCGGAGAIRRESPSLAGSSAGLELPRRKCAACGGTGMTAWQGSVDDRKYLRGRALRRYATLQQVRGLAPVGEAWLPPAQAAELTVRQRVQVKRATAAPCTACLGLGRVDCRDCKGQARVNCPERDCVNGIVTREDRGGLTRSTMKQTQTCRVCAGRGVIACPGCRGRGSLLCSECNGTGEQDRCRRCSGEGLVACRRCAGRGVDKGLPCGACGGEGVQECSSCGGDGRRE